MFNVKYKFIQLQLFDVKFLFSEEHVFRKQKRTGVYGRASLVSGFQLNRENDEILSSCTNIQKCKLLTEGIELTLLDLFEGPMMPQL